MVTQSVSAAYNQHRLFGKWFRLAWIAFLSMSLCSLPALAQEAHSHNARQHDPSPDQQHDRGVLLKTVRDATQRFKDVSVAEAEGYSLLFGCVSGDGEGAMGLHYVNGDILNSGVIDAKHPPIVIYEPTPDGHLHLIGADFLVFASAWDAKNQNPPELMGQLFHLFDAPNRFKLPAFYTLHVWAWKNNPNGAFVNWHPDVSCEFFNDKK